MLLLVAALVLSWAAFAYLWFGRAPRRAVEAERPPAPIEDLTRTMRGNPGPWGQLKYTRIATEPTNNFAEWSSLDAPDQRWFFGGFTREKIEALLSSAGLTESQRVALTDSGRLETTPAGIWIRPDSEVVVSLSPAARQNLYSVLAGYPENRAQREVFIFRPENLEERIADSDLSAVGVDLFRRLLYPRGNLLLFADLDAALERMPNDDDRRRFIKMTYRRSTYIVTLRLGRDTSVDGLVGYWAAGGRAKDVRPVLESLSRVPGGADLDIIHLVPPLVRQRLFTYPGGFGDPQELKEDCFWTALNFFNPVPDVRFLDGAQVNKEIETHYEQIPEPQRLGDLVLVRNEREARVIHVANYIADDIVFTKNGTTSAQPWIFMKIADMVDFYACTFPPGVQLKAYFMRLKPRP